MQSQKAAVRSVRKGKAAEVLPEVAESGLKAPAWLVGKGKEIWDKRGPQLRQARLLSATDELAFARYCRNFAKWIELRQQLDKDGYSYESESNHGKLRRVDPSFMIADRLERQLLALEDRFGMNPSERQRIFMARAAGKGGGLFDEPSPPRPNDPASRPAPAQKPLSRPAGFLQ